MGTNKYYNQLTKFDKETVDAMGLPLDHPKVVEYCKSLVCGTEMELGEDEPDHLDNFDYDDGKGTGPSQQKRQKDAPSGKGKGKGKGKEDGGDGGGKGEEGEEELGEAKEDIKEDGELQQKIQDILEKARKEAEEHQEEEEERQKTQQEELRKQLEKIEEERALARLKTATGVKWEARWEKGNLEAAPPVSWNDRVTTSQKQGEHQATFKRLTPRLGGEKVDDNYILDKEGHIYRGSSREFAGKLTFPPSDCGDSGGGEQKQAPQSWIKRIYTLCPKCKHEQVSEEKVKGPKPENPFECIEYKEKTCGCEKLAQMIEVAARMQDAIGKNQVKRTR